MIHTLIAYTSPANRRAIAIDERGERVFRMLSRFNLADGVQIEDFEAALDAFYAHLQSVEMVHSRGPVGHRRSNTPMDTDDVNAPAWFFVSNFRDQAQCDASYNYIADANEECVALHTAVNSKMADGIFICWEDNEQPT